MKTKNSTTRLLIEDDKFPFEFVSQLAEKESWRKEIHRPIYHLHKWWAKRLGSVFRAILLGSFSKAETNLPDLFYRKHFFQDKVVLDPFMGSGTTIGEAHKLGITALGRDINPVSVESVRVALGPIDQDKIHTEFNKLAKGIGEKIRKFYRTQDSEGRECDALYFFWVMQARCPDCSGIIDLFPSRIISKNAYPDRKKDIKICCPNCGDIFSGLNDQSNIQCKSCNFKFNPQEGNVKGAKAFCAVCKKEFSILRSISETKSKPNFRLFAKLVVNGDSDKEYLRVNQQDLEKYEECGELLKKEIKRGTITIPTLGLEKGHNTNQALNYGFSHWADFFNDRQLLLLGWLQSEILKIDDKNTRDIFSTLFSGTLEFNNMFASYKGEGTGAVRHMFSHHILKPERMPIEANLWGTAKSSGSFSGLFRSRLLRLLKYRIEPVEVSLGSKIPTLASAPFARETLSSWPQNKDIGRGLIYISCGDSSSTDLAPKSIDAVVTDPPFFDNVHYSELADFFYAWQQLKDPKKSQKTTRNENEVQDSDPDSFSKKLKGVFVEMNRILKDNGLLVFTYHHSRNDGWDALTKAIIGSGFCVVNSHPVKSEMSVAAPKAQAKEPIQLDVILVCRKKEDLAGHPIKNKNEVLKSTQSKIDRLRKMGMSLSKNDEKVVAYGEALKLVRSSEDTLSQMLFL